MVNVTIPFSEEAFSSLMERSYVHGKLRGHVIRPKGCEGQGPSPWSLY